MSSARRRALSIGLAMAAASGFAVMATPHRKLADVKPPPDLEDGVPKKFGNWRVDESVAPVLASPDVQATVNQIYDQIISRAYINDKGQRVFLVIAYGSRQTRQLRAHRQEVCYAAQGFKISALNQVKLDLQGSSVLATRMVATRGAQQEPVSYWFTMGNSTVMSVWDRQRVQLRYAMQGFVPDGYLVRFSSIGANSASEYELQLKFAQELLRTTSPELAGRLIGASNELLG